MISSKRCWSATTSSGKIAGSIQECDYSTNMTALYLRLNDQDPQEVRIIRAAVSLNFLYR